MKLNNHGWGLKQMLIYGAILFIALILVITSCRQASNDLGDILKNSLKEERTYATIEEDVSKKALAYINKYYKQEIGSGTITVTTENLVKYQMLKETDLITDEKDTCMGYVLIKKNHDGNIEAAPYIHCKNYETKEYQSWRIGE